MVELRFLGGTAAAFPRSLEETGCFEVLSSSTPTQEVRSPVSDGAQAGLFLLHLEKAATAASFGHSPAAARSRVGLFSLRELELRLYP